MIKKIILGFIFFLFFTINVNASGPTVFYDENKTYTLSGGTLYITNTSNGSALSSISSTYSINGTFKQIHLQKFGVFTAIVLVNTSNNSIAMYYNPSNNTINSYGGGNISPGPSGFMVNPTNSTGFNFYFYDPCYVRMSDNSGTYGLTYCNSSVNVGGYTKNMTDGVNSFGYGITDSNPSVTCHYENVTYPNYNYYNYNPITSTGYVDNIINISGITTNYIQTSQYITSSGTNIKFTLSNVNEINNFNSGSLQFFGNNFNFRDFGYSSFGDKSLLKLESSSLISHLQLYGNLVDDYYSIVDCDNINKIIQDKAYSGSIYHFIGKNKVCLSFNQSLFSKNYIQNIRFGDRYLETYNKQVCINNDTGDVTVDGFAFTGSLSDIGSSSGFILNQNVSSSNNFGFTGSLENKNINEQFSTFFGTIYDLFTFSVDPNYTYKLNLPYVKNGIISYKETDVSFAKNNYLGINTHIYNNVKSYSINNTVIYENKVTLFRIFLNYFLPVFCAVFFYIEYGVFLIILFSPLYIYKKFIFKLINYLFPDNIKSMSFSSGNLISGTFFAIYSGIFLGLGIYLLGNFLFFVFPITYNIKNFLASFSNYILLLGDFNGISIFTVINTINISFISLILAYVSYLIALKFGKLL